MESKFFMKFLTWEPNISNQSFDQNLQIKNSITNNKKQVNKSYQSTFVSPTHQLTHKITQIWEPKSLTEIITREIHGQIRKSQPEKA